LACSKVEAAERSVKDSMNANEGFSLSQNQPNPVSAKTGARIAFTLPSAFRAQLTVYDVAGRRLRTLVDGLLDAGDHFQSWDGRDDRGQTVSPGIYFYRLTAGDHAMVKRVLIAQ
jgi:flagellar hook assembly protein FlgD